MELRSIALAATVWCLAQAAYAQSLTLAFNDAGVTLKAQNVALRDIFSEWARLGQVTIVNGDDVVGPPVTLELNDVPERQVLDILLRSAAGYMLAARQPGAVGPSRFDRILILPSSTPPRPAPAAPAFQTGRPAIGQPRPPVQPPEAEPAEPVDVVPDDPDASQPGRPNLGPREVPVIPRPFDGVPQGEAPAPAPTGPAGTPPTQANPFGVPFGTTARPGIVTPPPQPSNPNARPDPGP